MFRRDDRQWAKQRRACVAEHFPTYFRLSIPDEVVSRGEIEALIAQAGDAVVVSAALRAAVKLKRRDGSTRAALLLDALKFHASDISIEKAEPLLAGVFAAADDIDVGGDQAKGFAIGSNTLRIHWLLRALLLDRTELAERSAILMSAANSAALAWLVNLASSAWEDYHPREDKQPEDEARCLVTEADARRLVDRALKAIKRAARDGTLIEHEDLALLLYRWRYFAGDDGKSVKRWTNARLKEDRAVIRFAVAFTSHGWAQGLDFHGLGDLVAKRTDQAQVSSLNEIMNRDRFRARVEALAKRLEPGSPDSDAVTRFLTAWKARELRAHEY